MAEVLSPIQAPQAPIPGLTPIQQPTTTSQSPPTPLEINTAFSPVDERGTFISDRIMKEGWLMQRTRKTKVRTQQERMKEKTRRERKRQSRFSPHNHLC